MIRIGTAVFYLFVASLQLVFAASSNVTFVTDSGICETVSGVHQHSGYINVTKDDSMFFWFFGSRNSPHTAPFTLWLNGGPGCSSLIGLFQENGPCTVNSNAETEFNPYSWNNVTNIMYIDQPIGSGFSEGKTLINDTQDAASYMWDALQILFADDTFSKYLGRDFIIATESYGARFAPVFMDHFNAQNAKVDSGEIKGQKKIPVTALSIINGKHDPLIQYDTLIDFATDAPGYGPLANLTVIQNARKAFDDTCRPALERCYNADNSKDSDGLCRDANVNCTNDIFLPLVGTRDSEDLRQQDKSLHKFPNSSYADFLQKPATLKAIGVSTPFDQCDDSIKFRFAQSGETGRSFLSPLAKLADQKFPILIWVGDADMKANWLGVHQAMVSMSWYGNNTLNSTSFTNMTLGGGDPVAEYKIVDNFTFARVYGAGHALPAFQPKAAQQIFAQFIAKQPLHSISSTQAPPVVGATTAPTAPSTSDTSSPSSSSSSRPVWTSGCVVVLVTLSSFGLVM